MFGGDVGFRMGFWGVLRVAGMGSVFNNFKQLNIENMRWLKWHDSLLLRSTKESWWSPDWVDKLVTLTFQKSSANREALIFHRVSPLLCRGNFCLRNLWFDWRNIQMLWVGVSDKHPSSFKNQTQKFPEILYDTSVFVTSLGINTLPFFKKPLKDTSPTLLLAYYVFLPWNLATKFNNRNHS